MRTLGQDLRDAVRMLGANTAIFSVVRAVILRSLPDPDPGRLIVQVGVTT